MKKEKGKEIWGKKIRKSSNLDKNKESEKDKNNKKVVIKTSGAKNLKELLG